MEQSPLIAVDIGNSRIKCGLFDPSCAGGLPAPLRTLQVDPRQLTIETLSEWLGPQADSRPAWWIGSVNRPATGRLLDWLRTYRPEDGVRLLASIDLPLKVDVPRPDMMGVDRLLDALAANALRSAGRAAVVIDVGSAITVDLVDDQGAMRGGAILPGIAMSAAALHEFTDLLPLIPMSELAEPPPALGTATIEAMRSGLFWGAVGAIRELIARLSEPFAQPPQVFLTGGAGPIVAKLLGPEAQHTPHLTLGGIALAYRFAHGPR